VTIVWTTRAPGHDGSPSADEGVTVGGQVAVL
jgi:hypothetical protein